jgi:large repetitive protein
VAHGASYGASASVTADQADPGSSNNQTSASVTISNRADLAISGAVDGPSAKPGQVVTYSFVVVNRGEGAAGSIVLADQLPAGLQLVAASSTVGACSGSSAVSCSLGTMASGGTATVTIRAQVTAGGGARIVNTATVSSPNHDPAAGNNSASVTVNVKGKPSR